MLAVLAPACKALLAAAVGCMALKQHVAAQSVLAINAQQGCSLQQPRAAAHASRI
jgi:hypothetical protein